MSYPTNALPRPVLMGIVNVTPDSFSDGGAFVDAGGTVAVAAAVAHGRKLAAQGAGILDIGGEASSFFRPGVRPTPPEEQLRRVVPVIRALAAEQLRLSDGTPVRLSVDTRSALVARAAVEAGAGIVNDIAAGRHDPAMLPTVAELGVPVVLMHWREEPPGTPPTPYADACGTVVAELQERIAAAEAAGVRRENIWLDPGIGFGKTMDDNWNLIAGIERLLALGLPVVAGISRKRFLDQTPAGPLPADAATGLHPRDPATAVLTALLVARGVPIHRVHAVGLCAQALALLVRSTDQSTG